MTVSTLHPYSCSRYPAAFRRVGANAPDPIASIAGVLDTQPFTPGRWPYRPSRRPHHPVRMRGAATRSRRRTIADRQRLRADEPGGSVDVEDGQLPHLVTFSTAAE